MSLPSASLILVRRSQSPVIEEFIHRSLGRRTFRPDKKHHHHPLSFRTERPGFFFRPPFANKRRAPVYPEELRESRREQSLFGSGWQ